MRLSIFVLLAASTLLLASCGTPSVHQSAYADPIVGYIYGVFEVPKPRNNCSFGVSFVLKEVDTKNERVIAFSQPTPLKVLTVSPGRYQFQQIVIQGCSGLEVDRKNFVSPLISGVIEVRSMTAVYLGDYAAQTYPSTGPDRVTKQMVFLSRQCRNFSATSKNFQTGWSNLSTLQPIDATTSGPACVQPV